MSNQEENQIQILNSQDIHANTEPQHHNNLTQDQYRSDKYAQVEIQQDNEQGFSKQNKTHFNNVFQNQEQYIIDSIVHYQQTNQNQDEEEIEYKPRKDSNQLEETAINSEIIQIGGSNQLVDNDIHQYKPRKYSDQSQAVQKAQIITKNIQNTTPTIQINNNQNPIVKEYQDIQQKNKSSNQNINPLFRTKPQLETKPLTPNQIQSNEQLNDTDKLLTNYKPEKLDQAIQEQKIGPKYSVTMTPQYVNNQKEQADQDNKKQCACLLF